MKEFKEETSTQKLYWDNENEIVRGDLFAVNTTLKDAIENIDAQERIRDGMNKKKTRVLVDMTEVHAISKEARDYFANERTASIQRATARTQATEWCRVDTLSNRFQVHSTNFC